jgi:hypothetical protein
MAERYRRNIYCDKEFLEMCFSKTDAETISSSEFEEYNLWRCLKAMILSSDVKLHLNINKSYLFEIEDKKPSERSFLEKKLFELSIKQKNNEIHLHLSDFVVKDNFFIPPENEKLTAFYFNCQDREMCQQIMSEYGVFAICPENIKNFKEILNDSGTAIDKNDEEIKSWKDVLKFCPCNAIALVDNYILTDKKIFEENLTDIFDTLLPQKLNIDVPFQISIFSTLKDGCDSQQLFTDIAVKIENLRPELRFKLSIIKISKDKFHDRTLVTNNFYVSCGGGFNLFKNHKSTKMTTVNIVYPFLNNSIFWTPVAYSNFIKEVSSVFNKATEFKNEYTIGFFRGSKENRLMIQ